jgi:hypothetical protein
MNMSMKNLIRTAGVSALLLVATVIAAAQIGLAVTTGTRKSASSSLIVASATEAIRACAYEARNQMLFDLEARLKATSGAMDDLSTEARSRTKETQEHFQSTLQEMKSQERALRLNMQEAAKATQKTWPQAREALAFSYIDYVSVVMRAESIAIGADT